MKKRITKFKRGMKYIQPPMIVINGVIAVKVTKKFVDKQEKINFDVNYWLGNRVNVF